MTDLPGDVSTESCYACAREADLIAAPINERLWVGPHWRVVQAFAGELPEWLIALPRRHVTSIAALRAGEAAGLGPVLRGVSRALTDVTGCGKTYVAQFAEADGFAHVHFHVVPRAADLPQEFRGPRVFGLLNAPAAPQADRARAAALLVPALRSALGPSVLA